MIRTIYSELFSFSIRNAFYRNGQYPTSSETLLREDFSISMSKTTQETLRRFGLVFLKRLSGFRLMSEVRETSPGIFSVAKKIDKKTRFVFFISLQNAGVSAFSEVAFKELSLGQIYYFNNLRVNADLRSNLRVSTQAAVTTSDDLIRMQSASYTYDFAGLIGISGAKVMAHDGPDVLIPKAATQNNGRTSLTFDLSLLPEGRYRLEVSGVEKDAFYYVGDSADIFGVFEVFFDGLSPNYQVFEPGFSLLPDRPQYMLRLLSRKTFWRYTVRMERSILSAPSVEISDGSTVFSGTLPDPKRAVFTSSVTIDSIEDPLLRGSPLNLIKVVLKDGATEKIGSLPVPDLSVLREENNAFFSEVTINI